MGNPLKRGLKAAVKGVARGVGRVATDAAPIVWPPTIARNNAIKRHDESIDRWNARQRRGR